jgi:Flp pilus assembly protein TadG
MNETSWQSVALPAARRRGRSFATTANVAPCRRGAAMVEFAMVTPLLFLFFFAAFEFCRVAMIRHTVDNAVYEGCRLAIVPGATADEARQAAESVLNSLALTGTNVTVSPADIDHGTSEVTVTVEVDLDNNTFVPPQFTGGDTITRSLTLQRVTDGPTAMGTIAARPRADISAATGSTTLTRYR